MTAKSLNDVLKVSRLGFVAVLALATSALAGSIEIPLVGPGYFAQSEEVLAGGAKYERDGNHIKVAFNNGCRLTFAVETLALRILTKDGVVLLANQDGEILPITYIPLGMGLEVKPYPAKAEFVFDKLYILGESITLYFNVTSADGKKSTVEWTLLPVNRVICGKAFSGVKDTFTVRDASHSIHAVELNGLAAVDEDYAGARALRFAVYCPNRGLREATFGGDPVDFGQWGATVDGGQLFHVLEQKQGAIFEYIDEEAYDMTAMRSNAANSAVLISHKIFAGRIPSLYCAPARVRLFAETRLTPQLWMELTRSRRTSFHEDLRVEPTPMRPMLIHRNWWFNQSFEDYAENDLPEIAAQGYRRLEIGWIYKRGRAPYHGRAFTGGHIKPAKGKTEWMVYQGEYKDVFTSEAGGLPAIKTFVDKAHDSGLEVYAWHQTAHGWHGDEIGRHHPDWFVHDYNGTLVGGGMPQCMTWFSLSSGFLDQTLERIREVKEQTGLDGFWLDMYGTGIYKTSNYIHPATAPSVHGRAVYTRKMREMGLGLYGEGVCPTVIDSFVLHDGTILDGDEFFLYGTAPFLMGSFLSNPKWNLDLFKLLSYQCFPRDVRIRAADPDLTDGQKQKLVDVKYRNRCYNAIEDILGQPLGVTRTPAGTQWVHEGGNVLFFHEATDVNVPLEKQSKIQALSRNGAFPFTKEEGLLTAQAPKDSLLIIEQR